LVSTHLALSLSFFCSMFCSRWYFLANLNPIEEITNTVRHLGSVLLCPSQSPPTSLR
jgi:hypothetical protein